MNTGVGSPIVFQPVFSPLFLWGALIGFLGLTAYQLFRQRGRFQVVAWAWIGFCRFAGICLLFLILARAMLETRAPGFERGTFAVLVDESRSMNVQDEEGLARIDKVRERVLNDDRLIRAFREKHEVRFYGFAEEARIRSLRELQKKEAAQGDRTDFAAAVNSILDQEPCPIGVLILSDGRDTERLDAEGLGRLALSRSAGLYTCGVGSPREVHDLVVTAKSQQEFAFLGDEIRIEGSVYHSGFEGRDVKVRLLRDEEYVESKPVCLEEPGNFEIEFTFVEKVEGLHKFTVETDVIQGEANPRNNRSHVYIQFLDGDVRILLVEGRPHWDTRFLFQTLREEPRLSIDAVFRLSNTRYIHVRSDAPSTWEGPVVGRSEFRFPSSPRDLSQYDILILGRNADALFTPGTVEHLQDFVMKQGGGLILARGRPYERISEALASLEPLTWGDSAIRRFRYRVTAAGEETPIFSFGGSPAQPIINRLPSLISATEVSGVKSLSVVLATAQSPEPGGRRQNAVEAEPPSLSEMAVVACQRYGKGRVMTLAGTGLWRWAFLPPVMSSDQAVYREFWRQVIRWALTGSDLFPGQEVTFRTPRRIYRPGETVRLQVIARAESSDYRPRVEVQDPSGNRQILSLAPDPELGSRLCASFMPSIQGEYEARLLEEPPGGVLTTRFHVYHSSREDQILSANHQVLRSLAEASGGRFLECEELPSLPVLLEKCAAGLPLEPRREDAWDRGWILACVAALFSIEWLIRRVAGGSR